MKQKALVAAVALAATGLANAAITGDAVGGSSLIFEAWDTVSGQGMVQNLTTKFDAFASNPAASFNLALDSASFATTLGTDTTGAGLNWQVVAVKTVGSSVTGDGLLTTISSVPTSALDSFAIPTAEGSVATHFGDLITALGTANFGVLANTNAASPSGSGGNYWANLNGTSNKLGFGGIDFYSITVDQISGNRVDNKFGSQFGLSSAGQLTYNVQTSATPLPAAAWLFGSGLVGLIGIGRRRNKAA
jgi:hypothetical protein